MPQILDDFEDLSRWLPVTSGLARLRIAGEPGRHGTAMRLDFDFRGGGGFVVARRELSLALPESYDICFDVHGTAPPNALELKLSDPGGRNVWWCRQEAFEFPEDWRTVRIRDDDIRFAWGPGGGTIRQVGAIELAIAAGPGGTGTVWIEDLLLHDRSAHPTPVVRASSALPGHPAESIFDASPTASWRSETTAAPQWLLVDFREMREWGGLVVQWERSGRARAFVLRTSADGNAWQTVHTTRAAESERSFLYLPGTVSRYLRLDLETSVEGRGFGIVEIDVKPRAFSSSVHAFFESVAARAPRGTYPKYLSAEQTYWSPVGVPDGDSCALLNEEGMVEIDRGAFSIEPFLFAEDRLITWADARITQELERGYLPVPSSVWRVDDVILRTTAFASRGAHGPVLHVRYRVENGAARPRRVRLFAAVRPFQVTPPWQAFADLGGVSSITELDYSSGVVWINRKRAVIALTTPRRFGAVPFEQGPITEQLRAGDVPARSCVTDSQGWASGALRFDLDLGPSSTGDVHLAIPFATVDRGAGESAAALVAGISPAPELDEAARQWASKLGSVDIRLPDAARAYVDTMRTVTAHILVQRDGPALQPGPRRYARSWIRDGAVMAAALLRMGCSEEARAFVRWYARHQAADGTVPCCVDRNGADWLVEHDSHGQLVFAVAECFRFTRDQAFLAELWPAVAKAVGHLEALRRTRLGPEFEPPEQRARYGLLPESVSHEGYLAHPVHAYWDDFWALRALADAAAMAEVVGDAAEAGRLRTLRDDFRETLCASLATTMAERGTAYLPASVEWADFDPTATANAVSLLGTLPHLPRTVLERTFAQYLEGFRRRRRGEIEWANYTPYEIRIVGALVRLGDRASANELLEFFLGDRRPPSWNQWPEIAWRDPKSPGHIGDMPHTWVGAEYVLAFRSMLAYEREDDALVVAAGVPQTWLDEGVVVRDLPTYFGSLGFTLRRVANDVLALTLAGDLTVPDGKIVVQPPLPRPLLAAEVDGRSVRTFDAESVTIDRCPATVLLRY